MTCDALFSLVTQDSVSMLQRLYSTALYSIGVCLHVFCTCEQCLRTVHLLACDPCRLKKGLACRSTIQRYMYPLIPASELEVNRCLSEEAKGFHLKNKIKLPMTKPFWSWSWNSFASNCRNHIADLVPVLCTNVC